MNFTSIDYQDYLPSVYNYTTSTISNSFVTSAKITGVLAGVTGIATLLVGTALVPPALAFNGIWCVTFLATKTVLTTVKTMVSDATHLVLNETLGDNGDKIADVVDIAFSVWSFGYKDVSVAKFINPDILRDENLLKLNHVRFLGNVNGFLRSTKTVIDKYINVEETECLGKYWSAVYINIFKNSDSVLVGTTIQIATKGLDNYQSILGGVIIGGLIDYSLYRDVCEEYKCITCDTTEIMKVVEVVVEAPRQDYNILDGLKVGLENAADFVLDEM